MAKLVSNRYAHALFEAGLELNKLNEFKDNLMDITSIIEKEPRLGQILVHPKISKDEKKNLLSSLFEGRVSQEVLNFLYILVDKRREGYITQIAREFEKLFNEHENIIQVTAITAVPMENKVKDRLQAVLTNKTNKTIKLRNVVDKEVMGGVLLKIENKVVDGTIKGQLEVMEKTIKNVSL
jgi:F-type H+-transporting ATPase subunit delta